MSSIWYTGKRDPRPCVSPSVMVSSAATELKLGSWVFVDHTHKNNRKTNEMRPWSQSLLIVLCFTRLSSCSSDRSKCRWHTWWHMHLTNHGYGKNWKTPNFLSHMPTEDKNGAGLGSRAPLYTISVVSWPSQTKVCYQVYAGLQAT